MSANNTEILHILLVIDLQKEFQDKELMYEKCISFIKENYKNCYIVGTVFKNFDNSMYEKHLGNSQCKDVEYPVFNMSSSIEYPAHKLILQTGYGINADLKFANITNNIIQMAQKDLDAVMPIIKYHIIGCSASAHILATAFELWDRGYDFDILTDYIYSNNENIPIEQIISLMKHNFGDCVI